MSNLPRSTSRPSPLRRFWKPVAITGAGSTAVAIWLDEIMLFAEEIVGLIILPILAGIIYLLDILIFKSRMPKREDLSDNTNYGVKK
jgi:hypothetical protein